MSLELGTEDERLLRGKVYSRRIPATRGGSDTILVAKLFDTWGSGRMEFLFHFWKVHEADRVEFRGPYVISEELADTEHKCEGSNIARCKGYLISIPLSSRVGRPLA